MRRRIPNAAVVRIPFDNQGEGQGEVLKEEEEEEMILVGDVLNISTEKCLL